ncbi:MAG TPA: biotin transporter BioY [Dermatophilaceae bacterium]|jgi:biotin transport system substrate-specific component
MSLALPAPTLPLVLADVWSRTRVADVVTVVSAAALTTAAAQIALPVPGSPVPVTGQTLAVLLTAAALGPMRGALGQLLYVIAAFAGLPVLAQHSGGAHAVFGATGGYLLGFIVAAAIVGRLAKGGWSRTPVRVFASYTVGSVVIYVIGATVLARVFKQDVTWALQKGVVPFLVGDVLKALLAAGLLPLAWAAVRRISGSKGDETSGSTTPAR